MLKRTILIALGSTLLCLPSFAQQLKPHTEFRAKLTGPLSTQANRKGDKFAAQVVAPKAFAGATLEGEITDCNGKSLLHRKAVVRFTFNTLQSRSGAIPIASQVKQVTNSRGGKSTDEAGGGIEFGGDPNALLNSEPASAIVVQMSSNGKNISFAPGSVFVLDVSRIGK